MGAAPLQDYYDHFHDVAGSVLGVTGVIASIAFQPIPKTFSQKAKDRGGVRIPFPMEIEGDRITNQPPGPPRHPLRSTVHYH